MFTSIEATVERLSSAELETRSAAALGRVEERVARARSESRDLTERESGLSEADRRELAVIKAEIEHREQQDRHRDDVLGAVQRAADEFTETRNAPFRPSLLVSDEHLRNHAAAIREGRPFGAVETRARVTAGGDLGSAGAWAAGRPNEPRHLITFAQIPITELTGKTAQVPQYTGPAPAAGVDEGVNHGEYDAVNPVNLTALRYGRWSEVSALANELDDLRGIQQMQAWGIARDLDLLAVTAIQTAASTPVAFAADLEGQVREAILTVAANTYSAESNLVIFGTPGDLSLLTGTSPANSSDLGSVPVRFAGARLYPTTAATVDRVTVFAPNAFRVFQSRLQSASLIDPASGANKFGSWTHSTPVAQQIVGAAVAVETVE